MAIIQYDIVQAFSDNAIGGVLFVFLMGLSGMFLLYILIPSLRNAKVMGMLLFILLGTCVVASLLVWPEFWDAFTADPIMSVVTAFVSLLGGAFIIPILLVLALGLILNVVGGRGLLGRGGN